MIHDKAKKSYTGPEVTSKNYELWIKHWYNTAYQLQAEFLVENLIETAKHIGAIIDEQKRLLK